MFTYPKFKKPKNEFTPLRKHVEIVTKATLGGIKTFRCSFYNVVKPVSHTNVKAHLLRLPNYGIEELRREHEAAERLKENMTIKAKQKSDYIILPSGSDLVQPKKRKGHLELAFNVADRDEVDKDCACSAQFVLGEGHRRFDGEQRYGGEQSTAGNSVR
ncbi:hypothetical protein Cgig2_000317 [Carnegiea gigantea]|uniref:Uncharacterized protein n=1 Tax=Carnegiea gigantea TaxID=171969 RepID=A0A9Q1JEX1_9CARY|nr:hypothetical protein Cgig2_000317 [Carnegiea gigantea]